MLKFYVFWGIFIAVLIGVVVSLVKRRQRATVVPGAGTPRLICIGGSHDGHGFAIPPGGLSVGRAKDNLLVIVDGRISAHHAWIGMVDGRVMLRDYQSLNGTFLDVDLNTRVDDAVLADGDTICFGGEGGEEFRFVVE